MILNYKFFFSEIKTSKIRNDFFPFYKLCWSRVCTLFYHLQICRLVNIPQLFAHLFFIAFGKIFFYLNRAEYSVFWKYIQTGFLYLFVQFCKMLILATFFPAFDDSNFDVLVVIIPEIDLNSNKCLKVKLSKGISQKYCGHGRFNWLTYCNDQNSWQMWNQIPSSRSWLGIGWAFNDQVS